MVNAFEHNRTSIIDNSDAVHFMEKVPSMPIDDSTSTTLAGEAAGYNVTQPTISINPAGNLTVTQGFLQIDAAASDISQP